MADNIEKYCSGCKHASKLATESPCNECCNAYTSKFKAKTNFDRIKEMSVDELADLLGEAECIHYDTGCVIPVAECLDENCKICAKKWLESEVHNND